MAVVVPLWVHVHMNTIRKIWLIWDMVNDSIWQPPNIHLILDINTLVRITMAGDGPGHHDDRGSITIKFNDKHGNTIDTEFGGNDVYYLGETYSEIYVTEMDPTDITSLVFHWSHGLNILHTKMFVDSIEIDALSSHTSDSKSKPEVMKFCNDELKREGVKSQSLVKILENAIIYAFVFMIGMRLLGFELLAKTTAIQALANATTSNLIVMDELDFQLKSEILNFIIDEMITLFVEHVQRSTKSKLFF
ncbi:hypothetical protein BLOT_003414 [Blomia tropicalis]|nr:hypothetical protein BLOT_003414 [Blomia tropicalis]